MLRRTSAARGALSYAHDTESLTRYVHHLALERALETFWIDLDRVVRLLETLHERCQRISTVGGRHRKTGRRCFHSLPRPFESSSRVTMDAKRVPFLVVIRLGFCMQG